MAAALEQLRGDTGVQLFVAYVDTTGGEDVNAFTEATAVASSLGGNDALILVAIDDRTYSMWVGPSLDEITDDEIDAILTEALEPALVDGDFAGAMVSAAAATGLAVRTDAGRHPGCPATPVAPAPTAGAGLGRRLGLGILRRRPQPDPDPRDPPRRRRAVPRRSGAAPAAREREGRRPRPSTRSTATPTGRSSAADEALKDAANDVEFAAAQWGDAEVVPYREAIRLADDELRAAFALRQKLDDAYPEKPPERDAMLHEIVARCTQRAAAARCAGAALRRAARPRGRRPGPARRAARRDRRAAGPAHRRGPGRGPPADGVRPVRDRVGRRQPRGGGQGARRGGRRGRPRGRGRRHQAVRGRGRAPPRAGGDGPRDAAGRGGRAAGREPRRRGRAAPGRAGRRGPGRRRGPRRRRPPGTVPAVPPVGAGAADGGGPGRRAAGRGGRPRRGATRRRGAATRSRSPPSSAPSPPTRPPTRSSPRSPMPTRRSPAPAGRRRRPSPRRRDTSSRAIDYITTRRHGVGRDGPHPARRRPRCGSSEARGARGRRPRGRDRRRPIGPPSSPTRPTGSPRASSRAGTAVAVRSRARTARRAPARRSSARSSAASSAPCSAGPRAAARGAAAAGAAARGAARRRPIGRRLRAAGRWRRRRTVARRRVQLPSGAAGGGGGGPRPRRALVGRARSGGLDGSAVRAENRSTWTRPGGHHGADLDPRPHRPARARERQLDARPGRGPGEDARPADPGLHEQHRRGRGGRRPDRSATCACSRTTTARRARRPPSG